MDFGQVSVVASLLVVGGVTPFLPVAYGRAGLSQSVSTYI